MSKLKVIKEKLTALTVILGIVVLSIGFSFFLGKYYLDNVVKSYPVSKTVYKKVYYPVSIKKVRLQPVSVYTLQAGVFTDTTGARQFAGELSAQGLRPYISLTPPYRVFVFIAPTREKLAKFKEYAPQGAFVVNDIFNDKEIEIRSDRGFWFAFLPQFAEVFSGTLEVIGENGDSKDKELSEAWLKIAALLETQAKKEKVNVTILELAQSAKEMAPLLSSQRATVQIQGQCASSLLKIKYQYDKLRQDLAKFD